MNLPLFFHIRSLDDGFFDNFDNDTLFFKQLRNEKVPEHTYCVDCKNGELFVGYSVLHENDRFNKKTGRKVAQDRVAFAEMNKDSYTTKNREHVSMHPVIEQTINNVIKRSCELLHISVNKTTVYISCSSYDRKHRKVLMWNYN